MKRGWRGPRTLASRLSLIFLLGLILAQALAFGVQYYERYQSATSMMLGNMEADISTSVAVLDHLPAEERPAWLTRLQRNNHVYLLRENDPGEALKTGDLPAPVRSVETAIGDDYELAFFEIPGPRRHFQALLRLGDGSPVTIDIQPVMMPLSPWLPVALLCQLALLVGCTWLAVRIAVGPLTRLANAVERLDPNGPPVHLDENGPLEVAHAAKAFNAMQERIAAYLKERMQLLAAISHDLQTPITRMKLRAEVADDSDEKTKLIQDLTEIEHLVREGIAYARSIHGVTEARCKVNLDSFLDSLVFDYQDTGHAVTLFGKSNAVIDTRPHALRRILVNIIDNAVKFSDAAEVMIEGTVASGVMIRVLDRGPGIPEDQLNEVFKPFYRIEGSRNRSTGGTGLGLAVAHQLAAAINASLTLSNRKDGGLCVTFEFVAQP